MARGNRLGLIGLALVVMARCNAHRGAPMEPPVTFAPTPEG